MPASRQARATRTAISPRLAMRTLRTLAAPRWVVTGPAVPDRSLGTAPEVLGNPLGPATDDHPSHSGAGRLPRVADRAMSDKGWSERMVQHPPHVPYRVRRSEAGSRC